MTEDHDDFAFEPVRGLPAALPEGERILWQGSPRWTDLAISAFHVRKVAIYFAVVAAWQGITSGDPVVVGWIALAAVLACGILGALAWFYARTSVYTLTMKRVIIRSGLALPITLNLPLRLIDKAAVLRRKDGTGSVALEVAKPDRVAWLVLWPHVRPWTLNHPQPMLRGLGDLVKLQPLLGDALRRSGGTLAETAPAASHSQPAPDAAGLAA